jgi:hypothetical protein
LVVYGEIDTIGSLKKHRQWSDSLKELYVLFAKKEKEKKKEAYFSLTQAPRASNELQHNRQRRRPRPKA